MSFLVLLLHSATCMAAADSNHEQLFKQGMEYYADENYPDASDFFSRAVALAPYTSTYHHWLGKSYGRQAEQANIFKAYELSKKTRAELERAVELDNRNIEALEDLMKFYQQAPGFLGGGQDKADGICRRLQELQEESAKNHPGSGENPPQKC